MGGPPAKSRIAARYQSAVNPAAWRRCSSSRAPRRERSTSSCPAGRGPAGENAFASRKGATRRKGTAATLVHSPSLQSPIPIPQPLPQGDQPHGQHPRRRQHGVRSSRRQVLRVGRRKGRRTGLRIRRADGPPGTRTPERGRLLPQRLDAGRSAADRPGVREGGHQALGPVGPLPVVQAGDRASSISSRRSASPPSAAPRW